jgi:hypothetical protein
LKIEIRPLEDYRRRQKPEPRPAKLNGDGVPVTLRKAKFLARFQFSIFNFQFIPRS